MARKRERLEVIYDILSCIRDSDNRARTSRILTASNLSSTMFREYMEELQRKHFVREVEEGGPKHFVLTEKGYLYLKEYKLIEQFMGGFGLKD